MASLLYACILLLPLAAGLVGFYCSGHGLNIATLDIGDCELAEIESTEEAYVQLLQLSDYDKTRVQQCNVEVDRIFYCGMHSHIFAVQNGRVVEYIYRPCRTACHETGTLSLEESAIISGVLPSSTISSSINIAGSTTMDAVLERSIAIHMESDGLQATIKIVVVQATIKIVLRDFEVSIERTIITILPSGQLCDARRGQYLDSENGQIFWSVVSQDRCQFDRYDVLYEGTAIKLP